MIITRAKRGTSISIIPVTTTLTSRFWVLGLELEISDTEFCVVIRR